MFIKKCGYLFLAGLMLVSASYGTVFAGDGTPVDESKYNPRIKLSSDSTIEVSNGTTKEVIIEVKNVGTSRADNFFAQVLTGPDDPFKISIERIGSRSDTLGSGVSRQLKLIITVDRDAAGKVYPVKLDYSYINQFSKTFSETDTLNIKVTNPFSKSYIRLYNFELSPETLRAGETGTLSFNYINEGSVDEKNARISLTGLDSAKITVPDGLNSQDLPLARVGHVEKTSFSVKAASGMKSGSYPIKIVTSVKNDLGETSTEELEYFINVGGSSASVGEASFDVLNQSVPGKTHGVGENFTISFDLKNTSEADAENVLVKAEAVADGAIVPTSQSMFMTKTFKGGEIRRYTFTLAATSKAKSQNYPISFIIEYDSGETLADGGMSKISFYQYFGVNINNPEPDDETDKETVRNIPKIIVSSYQCDPVIVPAGGEFDLLMTFMNSHAEKTVKNIKVSLTVTDKDDNIGASIFSPVNASNTLYIDKIEPKQTESRSIRYYAVPDANPQNYSINVNFDYEDADGNEIKALEIVGVNVSQPPSIETTEMNIPNMSEIGMPVFINFDIYNTGKVTVNNLKVALEGDMQATDSKTYWVGNFESGSNERVEISFYYNEPGEQTGKVIVSYDSTTGEHFEIPTDFSIMINEPMPMEHGMFPEEMPMDDGGMSSNRKFAVGVGVGAVALGAAGFIVLKRRKKKQQAEEDFYE